MRALPLVLLCAAAMRAQTPPPPAAGHEHHRHQHGAPPAGPEAATVEGAAWTLEELDAIAVQRNPTLRQAQAAVEAAAGLRRQAGRYPNPRIGALGEELNSSPSLRGGEVGVFVEQRLVTGGKLQRAREAAEGRQGQAAAMQQAQLLRVRTTIRSRFYEALAAQMLVDLQARLADLAAQAVQISGELANVGQADRPDVLQAEIEAQAAEMALLEARYGLDASWRKLAAAVGDTALESRPLAGDLTAYPEIDAAAALDRILGASPEVALAEAGIARASAEERQARAAVVPDIDAEAGFRHNPAFGANGVPIGREGFFKVGVDLPIFDRRRGAIRAARARLESAKAETERVKLSLSERMAEVYRDYMTATALAERYRETMLPKAREAYEMYLGNFRSMSGAYPQVLIAQRNWFQLQRDYVRTLERVWVSSLLIDGMLLEGALDGIENFE